MISRGEYPIAKIEVILKHLREEDNSIILNFVNSNMSKASANYIPYSQLKSFKKTLCDFYMDKLLLSKEEEMKQFCLDKVLEQLYDN